jgi:hypothetical protein
MATAQSKKSMEKIAKYADMPDHLRVDLAIRGWLCE